MSNRVIGAIGMGLLLAACGVSKDEFAAAQKDAANYKKQFQDEQAKTTTLQKQVTDLQTQNTQLTQSTTQLTQVGSSRVDLQACKLEYSIVSPK